MSKKRLWELLVEFCWDRDIEWSAPLCPANEEKFVLWLADRIERLEGENLELSKIIEWAEKHLESIYRVRSVSGLPEVECKHEEWNVKWHDELGIKYVNYGDSPLEAIKAAMNI